MSTRITGTDLNQWSGLRQTQGTLPAVVRELIMATAEPIRIQFPADEAVARSGLDGVLTVSGDAGPYVPSGDSVWEASTNGRPKAKATEDYGKRTEQTSADERAELTFVFVTSRAWGDAQEWVEETAAMGHGWKDIRVIEAEDLALWLNTCPGVEAWLAQHLNRPYSIVSLQRWFNRWSVQTDPETPAQVTLAGRRDDATHLLNDLDGLPDVIERCAGSVEDVVSFVAAALLLGPGPDSGKQDGKVHTGRDRDEVDSAEDLEEFTAELTRPRKADELEALLARTVVVETADAWSRWCQHERPQVLIPLFYPDNVTEAVAAGHHVVLPRVARDGNDKGRLAPLSVDSARAAWTDAGVDFRLADDYARASRRNLQPILVRCDGAGATKEWLVHLRSLREQRGLEVEFTVGFTLTNQVKDAIALVPESAWTVAVDTAGKPRPVDDTGLPVAQVAELTGLLPALTEAGWPDRMRVLVRRERPHPGAQISVFEAHDGWRYQCLATDTRHGQLAYLEARHRAHARVEDRIRNAKQAGLGRFPSREFAINTVWLQLALTAADLLAWTQTILLDGALAKAEPKLLRYRLLHTAARIIRRGRRTVIKIADGWPWADQLTAAFARLAGIRQPLTT